MAITAGVIIVLSVLGTEDVDHVGVDGREQPLASALGSQVLMSLRQHEREAKTNHAQTMINELQVRARCSCLKLLLQPD